MNYILRYINNQFAFISRSKPYDIYLNTVKARIPRLFMAILLGYWVDHKYITIETVVQQKEVSAGYKKDELMTSRQ